MKRDTFAHFNNGVNAIKKFVLSSEGPYFREISWGPSLVLCLKVHTVHDSTVHGEDRAKRNTYSRHFDVTVCKAKTP